MPFDPAKPATASPLDSAEMRAQFTSLKAMIDAQAGQIAAFGGAFGGLQSAVTSLQARVNELLPIGSIVGWPKSMPNMPALPGTWMECNGQVLADSLSPLDGQTLPDLNTTQRFLRGASVSGGTGGAESHAHSVNLQDNNVSAVDGGATSVPNSAEYMTGPTNHLPPYYEVVFVMRVR